MDWNGPNNPDDPRNFPFGTKLLGISSVTLLAFVSAFAGAIYAPAQEDVMKAMNCSSEVAMLPLSLNNLGMAFGPIVGAPLSEKYGRKTVYLATTPIFILFMVGAAVSQTISGLILCRFFGAIFGSPNISNASATILDYTYDTDRGSVLAVYYAIPTLAATVAPLAGGFVMIRTEDWRWTQWVPIILAGVLYCLAFFTKETYKAVILRRRAEQLGVKNSTSPEATAGKGVRHFIVVLFLRPVHMLFTEPIVFLASLYNGLLFGLLYAFVTSISWVFVHYYGFGRTGQALSYLGVTLGYMIACLPQVLIDRFYFQSRLRAWKQTHGQDARMPPEARLVSAMIGSVLLPAALLILSWTANFRVHWMVPIVFQGLLMFSCLLIYTGAGLFMLDTYGPLYVDIFLSCAFPLFTLQMFEALGVGWASTLLALLTLLLAPIPWIFWVYGPRIRQASRYETTS
ncbi:MFS general substrate transporter [Aspergillus violaceofuscus CBS 115571]|uniref:MFS general substrate transporter n=1 Tax=Aspergillus violaceofuscus (strain CBS 115571) TaxID=1450538 RepID=A0A2V5H5T5_ASPV1|nr:MFS general substrate transporter [Aspergillus violaceofuscus CBS 115571]